MKAVQTPGSGGKGCTHFTVALETPLKLLDTALDGVCAAYGQGQADVGGWSHRAVGCRICGWVCDGVRA